MSSLWAKNAIRAIQADYQRSADTHLIRLNLPMFPDIHLYLKDESTHPTGSLKHRLARSLFLYALTNGWIKEGTPIIEASSGSTAVSEAYFARLLGLPFIAVMPSCTAKRKVQEIEFHGGQCHFVEHSALIYQESERLAKELNGHYMDQFTYAERATDWRGNNNIAESIFRHMKLEPFPEPTYIVMSAGTGGTSATLGRYIRYQGYDTKLIVVDPENSVFYDCYRQNCREIRSDTGSKIEGIGRPRVEPSFISTVVDDMFQVPDAASIATIYWLEKLIGRKTGASTGTNVWGALQLAKQMRDNNQQGAIVTLICDSGERYLDTYYNPEWIRNNIGDVTQYLTQLPKLNGYK
ncbi:PLP-dependent cysteine synthase family protein [Xenorhabdus nematophila]|uniref:L-cysteine desulfhydrase Cds1 n=1 Tax=Xenorhabdus nematophila (strain ATCC 19061 / DSM 3370 / CCUG 14189 / LMG 1036 / NCIMB 9965 / AN6) TaxID=406817 RepID=D3VL85_XENNA|nr:PLP-dependent cysteine synthase family protein [Xenorhabdus nematophila]CEE91382.1 putative Cysteine synthase [Xenorhabdus nematophila str. Anatoliense]CEF31216.1 putative Cysteine synthase [Xenorhabdus nematophila str. Websteri]AYA40968.1 PLP-dependent cysteine synthase family protein [Xenorhabdus nematophila]KHD28001.1 cysteine synthase [Xenorhabdus nematophila]MBA0019714.1 PLP-dependent cysteine synthase family protein [Xenorhabdus nematophila]